MKKIAYAIARESSDDKTLQNQYDAIYKTAEELGYTIVKDFGENVSGDYTKNDGQDPKFIEDLRRAIEEKKPDAIFCYWIDRMTRTTYKQGAYLNEFSVVPKIPIYFTRENKWTIDPDTGEIDNEFLAALSADTTPQKERENIVARTTPARERVAAEGYYIGHLSDGFCVKEGWGLWDDGRRRKLKYIVIDEERKEVIQQIYSLFIEGFSTDRIAETLNAKGIPTTNKYRFEHQNKFGYRANYKTRNSNGLSKKRSEAKWSGTLVSQILQNEWYKGIRHYKGKEHLHDAIISKDDWTQAQTIREERAKHFRSNRESSKHIYLLQDLIFCGICGRKLYGHYTGLNNHYYCSSIEYGKKCGLRGICKENIEAIIYDCCTSNAFVSAIQGSQDIFTDFFCLSSTDEVRIKKEISLSKDIITDQEKLIAQKEQEIDNLIDIQAETNNKELKDRYSKSIQQRYADIQDIKDKIIKERTSIKWNEGILKSGKKAKGILREIEANKNLIDIRRFFRTVIQQVVLFNTEGRNNLVRINFKNNKRTEFIYSAQSMRGQFFPLFFPLYYEEKSNCIKSKEYPVYLSDGVPFTQSHIDENKNKKDSASQRYAERLEALKTDAETKVIHENTTFTVNDYILYLKSLPYKKVFTYERLEEVDDLGIQQRENYRQWRQKYNTGRPSQEPYLIHNKTYEDICIKRKRLYNKRYKLRTNKSLSSTEKQERLKETQHQLDLLTAQRPYIEGYTGKRKK